MPIDLAAFAAALRRGLGRCVLEARAVSDPTPLRPLVLAACRENQAYDPQCEGSRVTYLLELADATGVRREARDATLAALPRDDDSWDAEQLVDLARAFALDGDGEARQALVDQLQRLPGSRSAGAALVDVDNRAGLSDEGKGLLYVARVMGERPDEVETWVASFLVEDAAECFGEGPTNEALERAARASPAVARFRELVREHRAPRPPRPEPPAEAFTFERLLAEFRGRAAGVPGAGSGASFGWGRRAPAAELALAAEALTADAPPELQELLLGAFARTTFPGPPERLFAFALSEHPRVARRAFEALAHLTHPALRAFALARLADAPPRWNALRILRKNGGPSDGDAVGAALAVAPGDEHDRHAVGLALLAACPEAAPPSAWAAPLAWLYEHTPCSRCRGRAVELLDEAGALDPATRAECLHDCSLDTRDVARGRAPGP